MQKSNLQKIITQIKSYIVSQIPEKQLISLYLVGRILTKDKSPESDIDLFGIVSDDFDLKQESQINNYFEKNPKFTGKKECRFRALYLSDFEGRTKGKSTIIQDVKTIRLYLKLFRHSKFKLLSGKKINFSNFPLKDISDRDELKIDLDILKSSIAYYKKHNYKEKQPYPNMYNTAKWVLHITKLEACLAKKCKYQIYFYKLKNLFPRGHIFHDAMAVRNSNKPFSIKEKKEFIKKSEVYTNLIEKRSL